MDGILEKQLDQQIKIGGVPIQLLAEQAGTTPFFAYDRKAIAERVTSLRNQFPSTVKLHYAVKANPMPALACFLAGLVDGFDVASAGELRGALDTGMAPENISFAGPGKSKSELAQAAACGILINVESAREVRVLADIASQTGRHARVAIRINPGFELKSSGMKMGGGAKPFGVDSEAVPALIRDIEGCGLQLEGFHIFSGSQNLNAEAICEAQEQATALGLLLADQCKRPLQTLNIGGGFGIPYFQGDRPLDLLRISDTLHRLTETVAARQPSANIVVELGRYIVGEAGVYVCRVVDRKISRGCTFLVTDGGLHHHLAASGNFGQIFRKNFPVVLCNQRAQSEKEIVTIVGPLCTPLDIVADQVSLHKAEEGDLVVVFQSGAYGLTASPTAFLSHPQPKELLV